MINNHVLKLFCPKCKRWVRMFGMYPLFIAERLKLKRTCPHCGEVFYINRTNGKDEGPEKKK